VDEVPGAQARRDDRARQLTGLGDHDVRPPVRGAREQVGHAVVGGLDEQAVGHAGDALLEPEPVEVGVRGVEAGVHLGAAAPDRPDRQAVASHVVGQLVAGRDHHVMPRPLSGPRQRQHRVDVPERGFRGHQDAHAAHGPRDSPRENR